MKLTPECAQINDALIYTMCRDQMGTLLELRTSIIGMEFVICKDRCREDITLCTANTSMLS